MVRPPKGGSRLAGPRDAPTIARERGWKATSKALSHTISRLLASFRQFRAYDSMESHRSQADGDPLVVLICVQMPPDVASMRQKVLDFEISAAKDLHNRGEHSDTFRDIRNAGRRRVAPILPNASPVPLSAAERGCPGYPLASIQPPIRDQSMLARQWLLKDDVIQASLRYVMYAMAVAPIPYVSIRRDAVNHDCLSRLPQCHH